MLRSFYVPNHGVTQKTQDICITFIQCWTNVFDAGLTLYKCYTNVLYLLGDRMVLYNLRFISSEFFSSLEYIIFGFFDLIN